MPPQQQQPGGVVPGPANQYDFIVHPPQSQPPNSPMSGNGGRGNSVSTKKFFFFIGGGLGLVLILLLIVLIFSGGNPEVDRAVGLTQTQQELVRISEEGGDAVEQQLKNSAITTQLTVKTQQQQWQALLVEEGREVSDDELEAKMNSDTDTQLETGRQNSTFDSVFSQILDEELRAYASELNQAYTQSDDSTVRELAATHFEQLELLVAQLPEEE